MILYDLSARDTARRFSPHCWKARMALAHKGLAYETRPVPFTRIREIGDGFSPTVPVLDDGDKLVRDSFDIALYLEDAYPDRPSLFKGDGGKTKGQSQQGQQRSPRGPSQHGPPVFERLWRLVLGKPSYAEPDEKGPSARRYPSTNIALSPRSGLPNGWCRC